MANAPDAEENSPLVSVANCPNDYVVYRAADGDIHQLAFNGTSWSDSDLTTLSNAPVFSLAGPDSLGVSRSPAPNPNEGIYFKSVAGHLYTISNDVAYPYPCAGWCSTDLTGSGSPQEGEDPAPNTNVFSHICESSQEAHYVGKDGGLIQIAYYAFNSWWGRP